MFKQKKLIVTILVAISLLTIPGGVFAKMRPPLDIENGVHFSEVSSKEEVKNARVLLTEVANFNSRHIDKDSSAYRQY